MKELSVVEIESVSGAGKIQDYLSSVFGTVFSDATNALNNVFNLGYEADKAQQAGLDFGSRLGKAIENSLADFLSRIQNKLIG